MGDKNGLKEHMIPAAAELVGHSKKTLQCVWHHIANNTMATTSIDNTVRIWDVENQISKIVFPKLPGMATCFRWAPKGDLMAINSKGGKMSVFDIRK